MPERGEELVATFDDELAAATDAGRRRRRRVGTPEVLALYLRGPNVQLVFGQGSGIDAVIAAAGGTDLGTEMGVVDNAELSTEAIVAAAPGHPPRHDDRAWSRSAASTACWPSPASTRRPAAANRRVVAFEDQYLYGLGPRTGQLVGELVDAFHPAP